MILAPARSVRLGTHHGWMFLAEVICSDEGCEVAEEAVADLAELDLLVCEGCGCCLLVVSLSAVEVVECGVVRELRAPVELARAA